MNSNTKAVFLVLAVLGLITVDTVLQLGMVGFLGDFLVVFIALGILVGIIGVKMK